MTVGAVVIGRNDNYGGNLIERATLCLTSLINSLDRVIYIDWNTATRSLIDEIHQDLPHKQNFYWINVTPDEATKFNHNDKNAQVCTEVLARNIGIRRINTTFILSTNIDVISPTRKYFDMLTDKDTFYVIPRRNIPLSSIPKAAEFQEWLCENMDKFPAVGASGAYVGDTWSLVDCCGDFQFAYKDIWMAMRGFEESLNKRGFTDTNANKKAHLLGYKLQVHREIPAFHVIHTGGFGGSGGINDMGKAIASFTGTANPDSWGFSNYPFVLHTFEELGW